MIHRLELALMLLLLIGTLVLSVHVAPSRAAGEGAATDPAALPAAAVEAAETTDRPQPAILRLPDFDGFDALGFGLFPDLAPHLAPDRR